MCRLFIENVEVDLDESVQFAITRQLEDITNPTTIINSWSKTVEIPFTIHNNELFGSIFSPDRIPVSSATLNTGIYFNPLKKMDFRLQYDDMVVMVGYGKMTEIKRESDKDVYCVTLFGELGKVLSEMKKITFDTTSDDTDYIIDGSYYVNEMIDRYLINDSWTSTGQTTPNVASGQSFTNYIGFAPNNSYCPNFDYKTFQRASGESYTFTEALDERSFSEHTGIDSSTAIGNGLLPREIGEYRSYHQLPYIYFNKLFRIFQKKAETLTGYQFDLDNSWFNTSNPRWYNMVYMLQPLFKKQNEICKNEYFYQPVNAILWGSGSGTAPYPAATSYTYNYSVKNISNYRESSPRLNPTTKVITIKKNDNAYLFGQQLNTRLTVTDWGAIYGTHEFTLQKDNALIINTKTIGTTLSKIVKIVICRQDTDDAGVIDEIQSADIVKYISIHTPHTGTTSDNIQYYDLQLDADDINLIADGIDEDNFQVEVTHKWLYNNTPFTGRRILPGSVVWETIPQTDIVVSLPSYTYTLKMQLKFNSYNSFAPFKLNSLWNNEYNLLEEILKYMKMHRILIIVDSLNKKVRFIPAWKFYQNYTITDWTDKVDYSKEYKIQPVTWEDKYVLFGYKDDERDIISKYLKKYGINYGAIRLITDYNFNNETNKLFDNVPIPLISSDNILSWVNLYERLEIVYTVANETYVNCKNDNKDFVDEFGTFYMFEGLNNFDTADVMRNVLVSDDTSFQMDAEKYFYSQSFMSEPAPPTYPLLSDAKTVFTLPKELYTYGHVGQTTGSTNDGIYDAIWENYINERYNSNNKLVTCYVHINPTDYCNFEFNHFVKIENQLYAVNKIYDYDIDSGEPTKVDLITVQNLTNYYTNNL